MKSTTSHTADGLNFSARSRERQKHIGALNGALATGCKAPGLYGKKPLLELFCKSGKAVFDPINRI